MLGRLVCVDYIQSPYQHYIHVIPTYPSMEQLLDAKDKAWTEGKEAAAARMIELSEYFTGEKALTRVKRDENMMSWFAGLGQTVRDLNFDGDHATATGRKIQGLIGALEDVEQFEAIDTNMQVWV